jgi:ABC-type Fe3+-hydroxamate transport system substrate-binding protein
MISDFGKLFNKRTEAQKWTDKITFAYNDFQQFIKDKPFRKVAYFIWANPYMVAGKDTFINEMLVLNRFENIYKEKGRYPEIELEKIRKEGDPEVVFLSSEPFPFKDEHAFEIGRCTHHAKTIFVDGELFSWYGSRILKAFPYFKKLHEKL